VPTPTSLNCHAPWKTCSNTHRDGTTHWQPRLRARSTSIVTRRTASRRCWRRWGVCNALYTPRAGQAVESSVLPVSPLARPSASHPLPRSLHWKQQEQGLDVWVRFRPITAGQVFCPNDSNAAVAVVQPGVRRAQVTYELGAVGVGRPRRKFMSGCVASAARPPSCVSSCGAKGARPSPLQTPPAAQQHRSTPAHQQGEHRNAAASN